MLNQGILNPHINHLLARVRHTNSILIADRGFTYYPDLETVDISLVDGIPTVLQVLEAIKPTFDICQIYMAEEFLLENTASVQEAFKNAFGRIPYTFEGYNAMKSRVPGAIGIIRTADTIQYANMLLVSGRVED
jgi:D-ribose pyranase